MPQTTAGTTRSSRRGKRAKAAAVAGPPTHAFDATSASSPPQGPFTVPAARNSAWPIHAATAPDRRACLPALLAHGADPNAFDAYGTTPLRVAAIKGDEMGIINKEIIEALIKAGANAKMDEQYTQWLKDHPEAQSPAPPEMAGEEL